MESRATFRGFAGWKWSPDPCCKSNVKGHIGCQVEQAFKCCLQSFKVRTIVSEHSTDQVSQPEASLERRVFKGRPVVPLQSNSKQNWIKFDSLTWLILYMQLELTLYVLSKGQKASLEQEPRARRLEKAVWRHIFKYHVSCIYTWWTVWTGGDKITST